MLDGQELSKLKDALYYGLLALSLSPVVVALFGFTAARTKHWLPLLAFSIFTMVSVAAFAAAGGALMTLNIAADRQVNEYCQSSNHQFDVFTGEFSPYFQNTLLSVEHA